MKIAFYAPLKSPEHPVPSGDRLMAKQLVAALSETGNQVSVASHLRSFHRTPDTVLPDLESQVASEIERLRQEWQRNGPPDLWFCYHPYYKAPDLIGPPLARLFGIPYVTAEASYSKRRNLGCWARHQDALKDLVARAAVNFCFTERDRAGLESAVPDARLARIAPFIDAAPFLTATPAPEKARLVTVAMMRPGDKLQSYAALAAALKYVIAPDWHLAIVGDGPEREAVEALFSAFPAGRIEWLGELSRTGVIEQLSRASLFVWPGHGEAYGLAYLEAQAAGLPVIAENIAGVPEVVLDGSTGLLTASNDASGLAQSIDSLLSDQQQRQKLAEAARIFVSTERSLPVVARRIADLLVPALEFTL
ncbi:glycosyltransferase family 4 protein [Rhizobium sp. CG5]|uniref:glycosyltransferase family 4 protein n=1 Tax=Rhizobium sp. CG5 TaxID=2726076 RepID=UPI002034424C|nr:glycosyltransferase family 4 protein [Rhizobium sp. CG5]MCM2475452.1 glycosyltransferase family 4 protein [Rhizobium sp. CG5]